MDNDFMRVKTQFDDEDLYTPPDIDKEYYYSLSNKTKKFPVLMKWIMLTRKHNVLHNAIRNHLTNYPADVNKTFHDKTSPLHLAVIWSRTLSTEETVEILIDFGADVNLKRDFGYTPLYCASMNSNVYSTDNTVKILLNAGADVKLRNNDGYTPLHSAIIGQGVYSTAHTIKLLLGAGSDVNAVDKNGYTPLHYAIVNNHDYPKEDTIKMLLEAGSDVNVVDNEGNTSLHRACRYDGDDGRHTFNIVKMLIEYGANINTQRKDGKTALHLSVSCVQHKGTFNTAKLLLGMNTDCTIVNSSGNTPFMSAIKNDAGSGSDDIVNLFIGKLINLTDLEFLEAIKNPITDERRTQLFQYIKELAIIEDRKKEFYRFTLRHLNESVRYLQMKPDSLSFVILHYHFEIQQGKDVYDQTVDPLIFDYLGINGKNDFNEKISQYVQFYS